MCTLSVKTTKTPLKTDHRNSIIKTSHLGDEKGDVTCFHRLRVQMFRVSYEQKKVKKIAKTQRMSFHDDAYFVVVVVFQPKNLISARMMDQPRCLNSSS